MKSFLRLLKMECKGVPCLFVFIVNIFLCFSLNAQVSQLEVKVVSQNSKNYERIPQTKIGGVETYLLVKHGLDSNNPDHFTKIRNLNDLFEQALGNNFVEYFYLEDAYVINVTAFQADELMQLQDMILRDFSVQFLIVDANKYKTLQQLEIEAIHKAQVIKNQSLNPQK